ncbi:PadR family transcriptional regulator [Staphylococcus simiae]|uniref:PadR family transcriptional regulator n=1 Tax=Staphylococcus simiae TaxID=308354 RepID=UPI001A970EC9|nr:PadR family transcriptional regulator [Staphylococcus simiae]MBO1199533.1 PadR family transcriptional regulator [Staphylococcus simiae]MBO1201786.1 PadR family transcriptional regulator [Staphylococcus simiae]MBO1203890.1 PadR family transcriptional regulator [Staphylococcus simiae]MBO1211550.1 PadR family transcriptional regulator [Staphylococcus simiae]MBO1230089.1 PadR family transcriptional regulator [Staphylococcus simiae]
MFNRRHDMRAHMMKHEGFGFGKGFQNLDFGEPSSRNIRDRFFKKGNLQFIILQMLEEEPKHGYQIIKDLEGRFKGFYSPSPGSVYPILQMLEDRDFVSISQQGNKKVYSITQEGKDFLADNVDKDEFTQRLEQFKHMDFDKMHEAREQLQQVFKLMFKASQQAMKDDDQKQQFDHIIDQTTQQLKDFLGTEEDHKEV